MLADTFVLRTCTSHCPSDNSGSIHWKLQHHGHRFGSKPQPTWHSIWKFRLPKMCVCVCVHPKSLIDPDDMWHQRGKGTEQPVSYPQSCKDATANLICFHCIIHKFIQNLMWFVWAFFCKVSVMFRTAWKDLHRCTCRVGGYWCLLAAVFLFQIFFFF